MCAHKILEIACFNTESAIIAEHSGADRIEFCSDYEAGGISPPIELLPALREKIKIPIFVMVRPRSGNFIYSEMEIEWMLHYTRLCSMSEINGIVVGALTEDHTIDLNTCSRIKEAAGNMSLTFHRAFDDCPNSEISISQLIHLGVDRVLTSGGQKTALSGFEHLHHLQVNFGKKIVIMPGGAVRSNNLLKLMETGCNEFHSSALTPLSLIADAREIQTLKQLLTHIR